MRHQPKHIGNHAVVIGASIGGLLAGRVLSDYFDKVTIIDRDILPEKPIYRKGVPQSHHLHALLIRGQQILEHYFPDLIAHLDSDSATNQAKHSFEVVSIIVQKLTEAINLPY